jgi:protein-L-isoaspartate(D-aspartate) O-methyltransferase
MVDRQIAARGVRSARVVEAFARVPRERFVPEHLEEFAYEDSPLPIGEGQTISQPFIVAYMAEQAEVSGGDKVLEVGTGSGYASAVLAEIAKEVFTIERNEALAESARDRLIALGYQRVHVRCGDGTKGWPEAAPFDAILVAAGGPEVPRSLREQLAVGGRLLIPVGSSERLQKLVRIRRVADDRYEEEDLGGVTFVPLIGAEGWPERRLPTRPASPAEAIRSAAQPFDDLERMDLEALLERIGDARLVLFGEATHGTSEFYRLRARVTRELIERKGFNIVALEADWPDAAQIDHYVRHREAPPSEWTAFARFPTWMWRNRETADFVDWLHGYNAEIPQEAARVGFYGLDLYSLFTSIDTVLKFLDEHDPDTARLARHRYGCLTPWQTDPAAYGHAALTGQYHQCADEAVAMLSDLLDQRLRYLAQDPARFFDAVQNAKLIVDAERYYRIMYFGSYESWNLRDTHMFETLQAVLDFRGPDAKAVVWAHNSHVGNAAATEMTVRGEHNIGQLAREHFGHDAYLIGCGTDTGTVAAASEWDGPMEEKTITPAHPDSYEYLCRESEVPRFLLPLGRTEHGALIEQLRTPRLERAIGVIYKPETELASHYFQAVLPRQFDEYVWFGQTRAIKPLETHEVAGVPDTYPFGI